MKQGLVVVLVVVALILGALGGYYIGYDHGWEKAIGEAEEVFLGEDDNNVYCTQEAKECPDGSYVGREGPECEFAPCPES